MKYEEIPLTQEFICFFWSDPPNNTPNWLDINTCSF